MAEAVSRKTSASKSLVWRVMGVLVLAAVTYFFTRHPVITTKVTVVHHAFFLVVFYLHERAWAHVKRIKGRTRNIVKSIIYEIILGMGFGGLIVFFFTGSFPMVTRVTGTYTVIKLIMYFIYDRIWPELEIGNNPQFAPVSKQPGSPYFLYSPQSTAHTDDLPGYP